MTASDQIKSVKEVLRTAKKVFVLTGAGVSAESGVPTFRGGGGATVWRGMPFEQLSSKQMVEKDLPLVWEWFDYRRGLVDECEPNAAHKALAQVQQSNRFAEFSIVTQNIDGLHQSAGADNVIELHGSLWQARCLSCKHKQSLREIPEDERPPVCPECFDSMRPDVILFGEAMPMQEVYAAQGKAENCDVCFVIGTSALVYPAAELPLIAKQSGAKIIEINPEETGLSQAADISLRGKAAEILPLIFVEDFSPDNRLPDVNSVKLAAERTRKEKEAKNSGNSQTEDNTSQNDQSQGSDFMTSASHPLRVAFFQSEEIPFLNKLGLTLAPGKKQRGALSGNWNRDLTSDLTRLRGECHADTLVSLIEDSELKALEIENLEDECRNHSIELIRFPLPDVSVPPLLKSFAGLIREIVKRLRQDKTVVVHCKGGLGRAGLAAACSIVAANDNKISGEQAIKIVRAARGAGAVETKEQEKFISFFGEYWQLFKERTEDILRQQKTAAKEKVLEIRCEGGGAELYRFKTRDGKWYFLTESSSISLDENDSEEWIQWETEAVESIFEAIDSFKLGYQIFRFQPILIHPEIRAELKQYLENLYESLSAEEKGRLVYHNDSLITPDNWIYREMAWRAESDNFVDNEREKTKEVHEDIIQNPEELSNKHFLLYWQEKSVAAHRESGYPLDVVSSRQLKRAKAGDCLWIVTINSAGELILVGRLKIGEIVDYQTAVRKLNDTSLWDGGYFALPVEGEAEYLQPINIKDIQLDLRFANSEADRFVLKNGKINAQQLQTMRELSQESADLLAQIWESMEDEGRDNDFKDAFDLFDEENDAAELLEHCRLIVSQQPESAEAYYNLGVALDENELPEEAKTAYLKALELDPDYWTAYYNLGQYYLRARELDKAERSFKDAARLAPEFAPARFMIGVVYGELRDFERAIAVTKEGLESDPDDPKGHFNVGNFYFHLRDYEKAVQWLEQSLELAPDDPKTFYRLGECFRHLGEKRKEFDAYRQVIELTLDFDALFALGTVYAHLTGTAEGALIPYFETGGEVDFRDPRALFHLGLGNLALGDFEEACAILRQLSETDASLAERLQFFIDRFVPEDESENDSEEFDLKWLEPEESGFNIRVLDCRPFTETRVAFAAEEQNAITFLSTRDSGGEHHRGKSPENACSFSCDLSYPINALIYSQITNRSFETRDLPEGKLFSAAEMEEKWDVYYFDKYFYFVRSWTDKIAYRARAVEEGLYLNITEIEYDGEKTEDEDYHLRGVDYLLKTFVIGLTVPHPVPADVENTPESIALFSFSFAGRHAKFASFEDTLSAIPTLQAMDYVGPFDQERIREFEEQKETTPQIAVSKKRELIEIFIDGRSFEAKNIPQLYKAVLQYLVDRGKLENVSLPVATGEKRYILAKESVHPTGKPFLAPVAYKGIFMEAHNNRAAAIAQLEKLIKSVGCAFHTSSLSDLANRIKEHEFDIGQIGTYIWVELEEGNISGVEHFLEKIGEPRMFEEWIAEAKQKAEQEEKPKTQGLSSIKQNSKVNFFRGCLLGGAIGDALGAAIEFDSIQTIRQKFGEHGLTDYAPAYGRIGAITDDTQMTLFTAEGLLRAITRENHKGICHPPTIIYHAYLRWLETQGEKIGSEQIKRWVYDEKSWLRDLPELNSRRAPGNSCLSALISGRMGTIEEPINNSKGCGGVMRVAPIGLIADDAFNLAMDAAAITHGHPTGYLSAGVLALIIRQIVDGKGLTEAVNHAVYEELPKHKNHEETFAACDKAIKMVQDKTVPPAPETIESLGGGWIAEEALAIAIYCSLVFENDFKKGVLLAVNHSGDSDSTGAITGNILGALHGAGEAPYGLERLPLIPHYWLERLELKETIAEIAEDLLIGFKTGDDWWNKYPGI